LSQEEIDARRELEEAGWEVEEREGEDIWRNPDDGHWYEEKAALEILKGGGGIGQSD